MKKHQEQKGINQHLQFQHKNNNKFSGYLLKETQDFYTIELTTDVAGLNGIWYRGEIVVWSKDLTTILRKAKKPN